MFKKNTINLFSFLKRIKVVHIAFILIFLIQFVFVSIILFQNSKNKIILERTYNRVMANEAKQLEIDGKLNAIQSELTRLSIQFYRIQSINK